MMMIFGLSSFSHLVLRISHIEWHPELHVLNISFPCFQGTIGLCGGLAVVFAEETGHTEGNDPVPGIIVAFRN
jgi:hypothetical protein